MSEIKKNDYSFEIVNLSVDNMPVIDEKRSRDEWIDFGIKNDFYEYMYNRYIGSTTNNAVINNFAKLIVGDGLSSPDQSLKPNEWAKAISTISSADLFKVGLDLKMYGQATIQVVNGKTLAYLPVNNTRLEKKKDGKIEGVWFSTNFKKKREYTPVFLPMYDFKKATKEIEVIYLQIHTPQQEYYSLPDYVGGFTYCELEEQIANYLLNDVKNGFSGKMMISFLNGESTPERRLQIVNQIREQLTGAQGQQIIVDFQNDAESKTQIDTIPLNDAPDHYSYLSEECLSKILEAHNVTSPMLFGIVTKNGFSSNADELKNAWNLYVSTIVAPYQRMILDAVSKFLTSIDNPIKLEFKNTNPFGWVEKFNVAQLTNVKEAILAVNSNEMTKQQAKAFLTVVVGIPEIEVNKIFPKDVQLSSHDFDTIAFEKLDALGENTDGWELVSEHIAGDESDDLDKAIKDAEKPTFLEKLERITFANLIPTFPNAKDSQDGTTNDGKQYKIRYAYKGGISPNSREFCVKMVSANKVFRKDDIVKMGTFPVNKGFGVSGADEYSIWLYKGGARCSHNWVRQIYLAEGTKVDVNSPLARVIDTFTAQAMGVKTPAIGQEVVKPKDMPFKGYTEAYYKKHFAQ